MSPGTALRAAATLSVSVLHPRECPGGTALVAYLPAHGAGDARAAGFVRVVVDEGFC